MRSTSSDRAGVLALALVFTLALAGPFEAAAADPAGAAPTLRRPELRDRHGAGPVGVAVDPAGTAGVALEPSAPDGPAPDAAPFADLPANEIDVQASMPRAPGFDLGPVAFGRTTGQLCVLEIDNLSLYAIRSTDGGKTFAAPLLVAGGAGQPDVLAFAGSLSSGGKLYVAYVVADPAGGLGLRFTRTADMGLTWVAPVTLVASGEASFNVSDVAIAAGPADRVAVTWLGGGSTDPWVRGSTNAGVSWSAAVRVDAGVAAGTYPARDPDIDIDGTGNVYVAYLQNRDGATKVWTARSLNAGTSFQPEVTLGSGSGEGAGAPDVEVTNDGKILIAFWDGELNNFIRVFRSTNQGSTYTQVLNQDLAAPDNKQTFGPFVYNSPGTSVVLLAFVDATGTVKLHRSADYGATWGASQTMTTTAVPAGSWGGVPSLGVARTSGGNWLVAWTDARIDAYADQKSDIWLRRSGNGGTSWDAEKRVDTGSAEGAAQSAPMSITDTLSNDVFLAYGDARDDQRSLNVYSNRSLSSPINFTTDKRIDADPVAVDPQAFIDVATATDGAGRVYVAFASVGTGPSSDIYVAASDDGGFSYETPVRVGGTTAGQRIAGAPAIAASADGRVYVAFTLDTETQREVRFNRSADFGSTWQASDVVLGSFATPPGNYGIDGIPGLQLIAQSGGTMYLAWATFDTVSLTRSFNGGVTLDTRDVDQDTRGYNHYPALCANGNRLVLAMVAPDNALAWYSIWATTSDNRGDTWSTRVQLRPEGIGQDGYYPSVACDGGSGAVAAWSDARTGRYAIRSARFTGTSWLGDTAVPGPADVSNLYPQVAYSNASTALVTWMASSGNAVYFSRSTNSGASFGAQTRLDAAPARPDAELALPGVVTDRLGNAWISWIDESAGRGSILVRASSDHGATFGTARRVDRRTPQGAYVNRTFSGSRAAAAGGTAFFAWAGERLTAGVDTVLANAWDADDLDRDQAAVGTDCNDTDPGVTRGPVEVAGVRVARSAARAQLSWTSQDPTAGTGTSYDLVTGDVAALRTSKSYAGATCLAGGVLDSPYEDTRTGPSAGASYYYLLRAKNSCGTATYGNAGTTPDPRDALDSSSPCP